jgi:hypothetical protein
MVAVKQSAEQERLVELLALVAIAGAPLVALVVPAEDGLGREGLRH